MASPFLLFAQNAGHWARAGAEAYQKGNYSGASEYYHKALLLDSSDIDVRYAYAESLRLSNDYEKAAIQYRRVFDADSGKTFHENGFWLAVMLKSTGKYEAAKQHFKNFIVLQKKYSKDDKPTYIVKKAKQEIKSCGFAQKIASDSADVTISPLNKEVNTDNSEFCPVIVNDSTILFSSLKMSHNNGSSRTDAENLLIRIFRSVKKDSYWQTPAMLDSVINTPGHHSANGCFSSDGTRFYFSRCSPDYKCALYMSEYQQGNWSSSARLNDEINVAGYTSTQPNIANMDSSEVLLFVSDRTGGKGKLDIWYSIITGDNKYSKPKSVGSSINTPDNDISPFYDRKEQTLYFSSDWHFGLGGLDIFSSKGTISNSFTDPENIGVPFNSTANDSYFVINHNDSTAFVTSNRNVFLNDQEGTCCNDILLINYRKPIVHSDTMAIPERNINSLVKLNGFLPVILYFHNAEPDPESRDTTTNINYSNAAEKYAEMKELYKSQYSYGLEIGEREKAVTEIEKFFSEHVEKGNEELELFSAMLLKELEKGQRIELTLKGYASSLAKTEYNLLLTKRRISSLINYYTANESFAPYLQKKAENGGRLTFAKIPLGEYLVSETQEPSGGKRRAIFSPAAALERKIEIVVAVQAEKDSLSPEISFEKEVVDFGTISRNKSVNCSFVYRNTGEKDLIIYRAQYNTRHIIYKNSKTVLLPGEQGEITVSIDVSGGSGKIVETITLFTNVPAATKILSVTGEIILSQ